MHIILSLILLSIIFSLTSSRLVVLIYIMSFQGFLISINPLFLGEEINPVTIFFIFINCAVKGISIPWLLLHILNKTPIRREMDPIVSYNASFVVMLIIIITSTFLGNRIHFPTGGILLATTGIATILSGMFLLVARRKAITQVIGYIMMENGIYLIGMTLVNKSRDIVEFGILLDILVCVMIMVVVLRRIISEFKNLNTKNLNTLSE